MKKRSLNILLTLVVYLTLAAPAFAGQIVAWGANNYGQLDVPAGDDFVAIAAGRDYSLALKSDGSIIAWGLNTYGSVDNVPEGNDFVAIAASVFPSHNLALKSNGSLVGWGSNFYGQSNVPPCNDFIAIAAGREYSLVLRSDGSLAAWGCNSYGRRNVPSGNDFVAIEAGNYHNLAIRSNGSLVAWGYHSYGECDVPGGNDFVAVGAGSFYSVALRSDGSLAVWGMDNHGSRSNMPAGNDYVAIVVGSWHNLAIKSDGSLVAWGNNSCGQCDVPDRNDFIAIAAESHHSLALVSEPDTLVGIEIVGPNDVRKNYHIQYKALAHYDDGTTRNATASAVWWLDSNSMATIEAGLLSTEDINEPQDITIYAEYTEGNVTLEAEITVQVTSPKTLHVPTEYETIQSAIDSAWDGDTITVAPGTYIGPGNRDIDFKGKAITVRSTDPDDPNIVAATIIDCNGTEMAPHRGFYFHNSEDANSILSGFTITNGYANSGGGIYCLHSNPTITNSIFSANSAGHGGGISCRDNSNPTITNCTIAGNSAEYYGGGIYCRDNSSPTITNCTITGNSAGSKGGGIYVNGEKYGCTAIIIDCLIADNTARCGAGIYFYCVNNTARLINCTIIGNSAKGEDTPVGAPAGGGIYCGQSSPAITNCIITDNTTDSRGAGIYCGGYSSNPIITNCTISGNSAKDDGGGIFYWCYDANPTITNCILWDNSPQQIVVEGGAIVSVTYSNVQDTWPGEGNINEDPHLAFSTDYHLMPTSPCIDAGTNTPTGGLPATDIEGNPRPLDGDSDGTATADIGACEYNPQGPSIALSSSAFSFYSVQGLPKPAPQTLLIRNCGVGTLNWQIVEDCNWLQVAPTSGVSTGNINEITLMVDHNSLAPGYYTCVFYVLDPDAVNSPVMVKVLLSVGALLCVPQQFPTIQAAIDAAGDYDVVMVSPGTYTGEGNRDIDFKGKPITVRSTDPDDPNIVAATVIDCQEYFTGFDFHNAEDNHSILSGFKITNGYTGIWFWDSSPTVTNCIISGNSAELGGGGIYCFHSSPTITNCFITDNSSDEGGGISCRYNSSPTITNCKITGNSAGSGGGIACWDSNPTIANCTITDNSAEYYGGGGMYNYYSSPTITNCTIAGNSAERDGGGIYSWRSDTVITNCTITGNSAERDGGGIFCGDGSPTITNCTITGNLAIQSGGGICCYYDSNPTITNCTFAQNYAANGNALACDSREQQYPSNLQLTNCILWDGGNEIWNNDGSTIDITYSNVQDGWPGTGNIDEDPCFVLPGCWADANDPNIIVEPNDPNAIWFEGDYHLYPFSLCINAGDPNYVPEPNETDLDGSPRIIAGRIDMGAYESNHIHARLWIFPRLIHRYSHTQRRISAWLRLPKGITREDIDSNTPLLLYPGEIEPLRQYIFQRGRRGPKRVSIIAYFDKRDLMNVISNNGRMELKVVGRLRTGQYFYGTDTIRIIHRRPPPRRPQRRR